MGRLCTICRLKRRRELERDFTAGVPISEIASRYNVGKDSARRHLNLHFMEPVEAPLDGSILIQGVGALEEQLQRDITRLRELAVQATNAGDLKLAGNLLSVCVHGHTSLLTSRDRRLGHNAQLWARVIGLWGDNWTDSIKLGELIDVLSSGAFLAGEVKVDLTPRKLEKNKETESKLDKYKE